MPMQICLKVDAYNVPLEHMLPKPKIQYTKIALSPEKDN